VASNELDGAREQLEAMRPTLKARQRREREVIKRLTRDGYRESAFYTTACPVQLEGRLPSGEAFYLRARGTTARLDIGTKGGTPEDACRYPSWTKRVTRWEWPQAGWLEPVASEALLRELAAAYQGGKPTDTVVRELEPEVAAVVAEAKAKEAVVVTLDRDLLVRGEGMTPEEAMQRFAEEEAEKAAKGLLDS
jgi:hypothetical protein